MYIYVCMYIYIHKCICYGFKTSLFLYRHKVQVCRSEYSALNGTCFVNKG